MSLPLYYRPKFLRHLHHLVINGFYARELDADDHEFLEYVKVRGIANGTLPHATVASAEELDFWNLPYTFERGVRRKMGPVPRRIAKTPLQQAIKQARSIAWHGAKTIRERDKAIAAAELARARREWEKAQAARKMREATTDAEWKAAAPGKTVKRHHVPQWKLDEQKREQKLIEQAKREARQKRQDEARKRQEEHDLAQLAALQEQAGRRKVVEEARQTLARLEEEQRERAGGGFKNLDVLKQAILTLLRSTPGRVWSREELIRGTGCVNPKVMDLALERMVREGQLKRGGLG